MEIQFDDSDAAKYRAQLSAILRENPDITIELDKKYTESPTEYEIKCTEVLRKYAEDEGLKDFAIQHNKIIKGDDGDYQIDIFASFTAMGVKIKVLAECKRYSSPVTREKVVILADKVKQLGAHKGILISTSGFQSGALKYGEKHGVALLQINYTPSGPIVIPHGKLA